MKEQFKFIKCRTKFILGLATLFIFVNFSSAQTLEKGKISGKLVDAETGEPLIGANVYLENTALGASSDLDGYYFIPSVPAGNYELVVTIIQYSETRIKNLEVNSGESVKLDLAVKPEILTSETIVVEAKALKNTEAALLGKRQKSNSVSDAISAEAISRSGSGDAASAMKMVTGASVVGGKYVYVRGLGERYASTHLNGAELPSADPDKKAFQMDLFPSNLLDNIVTQKTFTPDKPGNFSGGIVDIGTKTFPDKFNIKFSSSTEYNSNTTFNNSFLSYPGGDTDWLGMDDGTRESPKEFSQISQDHYNQLKNKAIVNGDLNAAKQLDYYSNLFNSVMSPNKSNAPINQSYSISIGDQFNLFGRNLGYQSSVTYSNKYSFYDDGTIGKYKLPGNINNYDVLVNEFDLSEVKGIHDVSWGGLLNLSYKFNDNHQLHSNLIYTKSGESSTRFIDGVYNEGTIDDAIFETRVLKFTERDLFSSQLKGEHFLTYLNNAKVEWIGSYAVTTQDEPDTRFFSDHYYIQPDGSREYQVKPAVYPVPARYFRNLEEDNYNINLNIGIPFTYFNQLPGKVKIGGAFTIKDRKFRENTFKYENNKQLSYNGDPDSFFSSANTGILYNSDGSIRYDAYGNIEFGNYIVNASEDKSNYNGNEKIVAGYGMIELPVIPRMKLITGVRYERTDIDVQTLSSGYETGKILENDILPSVNIVYNIYEKMNLRLAYGRTLARPTMRELAPFSSEDFAAGFIIAGNPDLKRTLIDNFDIRLEWFERPGEIYAVSGFYKSFTNPIERVIRNDNNEIRYENVDNAILIGAEFELRKKLDQVSDHLSNFQFGANLSLVYSRVDIPANELQRIRVSIPEAEDTRELQGQSPYLLNLNVLYDHLESGTSASLFYNVFGERLSEVTLGATPNIFEKPRHTLNFSVEQKFWQNFKLKFSAKNILDSQVEKIHRFKDKEFVYQKYSTGRNFAVGLSYAIN